MSEVKPVIKTAEERMQEWTAATELDIFIQLSAAQFRDFLGQEVKELRAALESSQKENAEQAKRIAEQLEVIEATAEFAKAFWEKSDKRSDTRVMVSTFQQLERKLRTYL